MHFGLGGGEGRGGEGGNFCTARNASGLEMWDSGGDWARNVGQWGFQLSITLI